VLVFVSSFFSPFLNLNFYVWIAINPMKLCCKILNPLRVIILNSAAFLQRVLEKLSAKTKYIRYVSLFSLLAFEEFIV